ncbi:ParB N-terminal domain-containing protein [Spirulina subsalsa FACHB-351]|uniref:ParB N-terminal domain-containing protein n=1 Tax=Spirulina subsalsa FACHB-351 TaxID=234711 RepID=A0ABT3LCX7_9CYAN|nr:ParB N-terminal domain-containing protein [Spirulina subsalsa]MCW6038964.1 ParB N-terminal domain-containing protein [Spirulina subsalsa FACHB-351]
MVIFLMIDIENIICNSPRSDFSESQLEKLADYILKVEGLLQPVIVKKAGFESYELIAGELAYHAAMRAKEKNPHQGEMVNAFVIQEAQQSYVIEQLAAFFEALSPHISQGVEAPETPGIVPAQDDQRLFNLEQRLEQQGQEIRAEFNSLFQQLAERINLLETTPPPEPSAETSGPVMGLLDSLNVLDGKSLRSELERRNIPRASILANAIITARDKQPQQVFRGYGDVVASVKGLGDKTLIKMIDAFAMS